MKLGYWIGLYAVMLGLAGAGCTTLHAHGVADDDFNRAIHAQQVGQTDKAIEALQMATQSNPELMPAHAMLGDIYRDRGQFDLARREYQTCSKLEPRSANHLYDMGLMNQLMGRLQQAADSYLKSLKLKPDNADANMNLGLVYLSLGDHDKSIEHLRQAAEQNPYAITVWTNLAAALDDSGDLAGGEKVYRKAMELDGDKTTLYLNYAQNLIQQKRPDDAISLLQQSIDVGDTAMSEKYMGDALVAKGWLDAAVGRYERAARLDHQYTSAYNELGKTLIMLYDRGLQLNEGLRERALSAWRMSLSIDKNQPTVADELAKRSRTDG